MTGDLGTCLLLCPPAQLAKRAGFGWFGAWNEEQVLYPELRRIVDDGDDLANVAEDEHGAVRALIARVYEAPPPDLAPLIDEMRQLVERHVESEENDLFPRLRDSGADAEALGRRADAARGEASSRSSGQVG